jgi:hypothetical protein
MHTKKLPERGMPVVQGVHQSILGYLPRYPDIIPDTPAWFVWLGQEDMVHFAFYERDSDECLCRVQKRDGIWYAYRRGKSKTRQIKIGSSEDVTIAALWNAYHKLVEKQLQEDGVLTRQD